MSHSAEKEANEKVFLFLQGHFKAVTDGEGTIRIFRWSTTEESNELLKEYRCHEGPIVSLRLAPIQYKPYLLSIGLDLKINLFNLSEKHSEPVFEFSKENIDLGYFTAAEFLNCSKDALRFIVGTSSGTALFFNSDKNFAQEQISLGNSAVKALSAGPKESLASVCQGATPRIYFDSSFSNYIEFGANLHDSKRVVSLFFQDSGTDEAFLITAGEDLKVGLWLVNLASKGVSLLKDFTIRLPVVNGTWDLGGLGATLVIGKKVGSDEEVKVVRISKGIEEDWALKELDIEK